MIKTTEVLGLRRSRVKPSMIFPVLFGLLGILFLGHSSPEPSRAEETSPDDLERVLVKVNDVSITLKVLNRAVQQRIPATGHRTLSQKRFSEIQREELDRLIVTELLVQEARRLEIKVDPAEIDSELKDIRDRFPEKSQFEQALQQQDLTLADIHRGLERHIMTQKVIDQEVHSRIHLTDSELRSYYDGYLEQFQIPEQIRLRLILVRVDPSGLREDWEEGRKKARKLADRVRSGEDFASLAKEFSDDEETRLKGGDMGLLHRGRLPYYELESIAFSHGVGEVSDPVATLYGYVVFKVEEKRPAKQLTYDEVNKELLRREMREAASKRRFDEWMENLKAKADIQRY